MDIAFVSNLYTPHQVELSKSLCNKADHFYFIETKHRNNKNIPVGWRFNGTLPDYVITFDRIEEGQRIIDNADVVIIGSAPDYLLQTRHKKKALTFRYSERIYRNGCPLWQIPLRYIKYYFRFDRYKNDYLLCAGAYAAADYALTNNFVGKSFKWGYFTPVSDDMDISAILEAKRNLPVTKILWVARFLKLKHPERMIQLAQFLKKRGYENFVINMVGSGEEYGNISNQIIENGLENHVQLLGDFSNEEVHLLMREHHIFCFTSDSNEGWGAVLNEAMSNGCTVVASHIIGATPFLVHHRHNGLIYSNDNVDSLFLCVQELIEDQSLREEFAVAAYEMMKNEWCAEIAAERFIALSSSLLEGKNIPCFDSGPCSKSEIILNNWFNDYVENN